MMVVSLLVSIIIHMIYCCSIAMKRKVFFFKHHRYVALFEARVPQNPLCFIAIFLIPLPSFGIEKHNVQTNQKSAVKKTHKLPILARSEGTHSYKVLLLCFYNSIYLYMIYLQQAQQ